jgi:hypothetical protein
MRKTIKKRGKYRKRQKGGSDSTDADDTDVVLRVPSNPERERKEARERQMIKRRREQMAIDKIISGESPRSDSSSNQSRSSQKRKRRWDAVSGHAARASRQRRDSESSRSDDNELIPTSIITPTDLVHLRIEEELGLLKDEYSDLQNQIDAKMADGLYPHIAITDRDRRKLHADIKNIPTEINGIFRDREDKYPNVAVITYQMNEAGADDSLQIRELTKQINGLKKEFIPALDNLIKSLNEVFTGKINKAYFYWQDPLDEISMDQLKEELERIEDIKQPLGKKIEDKLKEKYNKINVKSLLNKISYDRTETYSEDPILGKSGSTYEELFDDNDWVVIAEREHNLDVKAERRRDNYQQVMKKIKPSKMKGKMKDKKEDKKEDELQGQMGEVKIIEDYFKSAKSPKSKRKKKSKRNKTRKTKRKKKRKTKRKKKRKSKRV